MAKRSEIRVWYLDESREPDVWECQYYDTRTSPGCIILLLGESTDKPERRKVIPYHNIRDMDVKTWDTPKE